MHLEDLIRISAKCMCNVVERNRMSFVNNPDHVAATSKDAFDVACDAKLENRFYRFQCIVIFVAL